ncbi:hypothetical protein C8Q77DRAFT_1074273 [Trametes polyzona]|nr:hypothetical protein C8Q77DRAFT_1074273 [Trametes polyzona]
MPQPDDDGASAFDPASAYLALYTDHLEQFRAHLAGRDAPEAAPASYLAPNAYWLSSEKDAFFRGLAIHSRLRPDLIAAEVKTKTVPDVCVYLALLEQAAHDASSGTVYVGAEKSSLDPRVPRKDLPSALEVSADWIEVEERVASALVGSEPVLRQEMLARERARQVRSRQKSFRARKGEARTASNERDREGEKQRRKEFDAWVEESEARWAAEDAWHSLDHASLAALDRMLREDEEGYPTADPADHDQGEVLAEQHVFPPLEPVAASATQSAACMPAPGVADELIDPMLLEISRPGTSTSFVATSIHPVDEATAPLPDPVNPSAQSQAPTFFTLVSNPAPGLLSPADIDAVPLRTLEDESVGDALEEDMASMSPVSRRRFQKRLYMRRKRAQRSGAVPDEHTARLKPGRKPKQRPSKTGSKGAPRAESPTPSSPMVVDGEPLPVPHEATENPVRERDTANFRHPKGSGKTLPYRRHAQLSSIGINAPRLYQEGLGLFHFQSISKLMRTYNDLHDVPPEVASEITVETFQLLHGIITQFVAEVMSRAITSREQERIAKLQTKAWHLRENQNISAVHVKHALALFGADTLDKRSHFASLLEKLGLDDACDEVEVGEEEDREGDASPPSSPEIPLHIAMEDDDAQELPAVADHIETHLKPLSSLRMIFPPFCNPNVAAPSSSSHDDALVDPSVYMPWPSSSLLSTSSEPPREEDLVPEEIDEVALAAELLEDQNIDKEDHLRDLAEEDELWRRFGGRHMFNIPSGSAEPKIEPPEAAQRPRKRKRKGRPKGRSKSVRIEEAAEGGEGDEDDDAGEQAAPGGKPRARSRKGKNKGKGTAHLKEDQLRFMEPDPNGRIKSSVYVLDSDSD